VLPTIEALDRIDVVFLDLEMPNGDYYLTLHELKQQPSLTGVPIVAYTVHTSEIDKARQAGFDGFLGKPLKATEFPGHLQRILGREPVWVY
jgi:two-component system cell cycle response regulator DivK